jgi:alpha-glucoside transport system permease protein
VFFKIKVPQIMGTIVVVWTTITILVLKVFDIVYAMTNGNFRHRNPAQLHDVLHVPR